MSEKISRLAELVFGDQAQEHRGANLRPSLKNLLAEIDKDAVHPKTNFFDRQAIVRQRDNIIALQAMLAAQDADDLLLRGVPLPTAKQIRAVAKECFFEVPDEIKQEITKLQEAWLAEMKGMEPFFPHLASRAYREHQSKIQEGIIAQGDANLYEGWSFEDWEEDFSAKLSAYKAALKRHSVAAYDLVYPQLEHFCALVKEYADTKEANQRSLCETYELAYEPTRIILLLLKTRQVVRQQIESYVRSSGQSPSSVANFILD